MRKISHSLDRFKRSLGIMGDREPIVDESESPRGSHLMNSDDSHTSYAELMNGSVPCPSCNGRGNIPREMETQLVALIPVSDSRLKPRRTCLYVSSGMSAVVVIAALSIFFLLPREVSISSQRAGFIKDIEMITYEKQKMVIQFPFIVEIKNDNYYWVNVHSFNATFFDLDYTQKTMPQIGTAFNTTPVSVPPRSQNYPLYVTARVTIEDGFKITVCNSSIDPSHIMRVPIDTQSQVSVGYFMAKEVEALRIVKSLCCMPSGNCTAPE